MPAEFHAIDVAAHAGGRELFTSLNLVAAGGDVIGLVGPNGVGKSTLLRMLAGIRPTDAGRVSLVPADANIGYLPQESEGRTGETLLEYLNRRTGVGLAEMDMNQWADSLAAGSPGADDAYSHALERWLAIGGADLDDRIPGVLADVGLDVSLELPMDALSGGQSARAGLAALLLSRYDGFLLDEPTNDLDIEGLERLEDFVLGLQVPVILVSHDREFLARTVNKVVEIDRSLRRINVYGGGYEAFREEREVTRRHARQSYDAFDARRSELEARARTQRAWMAKGVKNARRKSPDNDKVGRNFRSDTSEKQAQKVRQTERLIERLDAVEEPRKEWRLQFTIKEAPRSGAVVAVARGATATRGSFALGSIDFQINLKDRIAITGPNGGGKSTLLALILGRAAADNGSVTLGSGVVIGEVDQSRSAFEGPEPLQDQFARAVPDWATADVRTLLAKFGLNSGHVNRPASSLSPGERTRAALALLQARGVNLLVLDEPTNHLDVEAIEQLEEALENFDGTILLVTHDRRMLERVRLTRRWEVEGGALQEIGAD